MADRSVARARATAAAMARGIGLVEGTGRPRGGRRPVRGAARLRGAAHHLVISSQLRWHQARVEQPVRLSAEELDAQRRNHQADNRREGRLQLAPS